MYISLLNHVQKKLQNAVTIITTIIITCVITFTDIFISAYGIEIMSFNFNLQASL